MKTRVLSMILAVAMVVSMVAGLAVTASAASFSAYSEDTVADGQYVIVFEAKTSGDKTSFSGSMSGKYFPATTDGFTVTGDSLTTEDDSLVRTITKNEENGFYTVQNADGKYLQWSANKNAIAAADEVNDSCYWNIVKTDTGYEFRSTEDTCTVLLMVNGTNVYAMKNNSTNLKNYVHAFELYAVASAGDCNHANATSEVVTESTCTVKGEAKWTCPDCGATWTTDLDLAPHTFGEAVVTPATCTEDGTSVVICTVCGKTQSTVIESTGHQYGEDGICTVCGAAQPKTETFTQVTDAAALTDGTTVILVDTGKAHAMSVTQNNNNRGAVEIALNEDGTITADPETVAYLTLVTADGGFAMQTADGGYLYAASSSGNYLRTQSTVDANATWAFTANEGVFTVKAQGTNARATLNYNSGADVFSAYTSGSVLVYKAGNPGGSGSTDPELPTDCFHTDMEAVAAKAATCTEDGNIAYWHCPTCGNYYSDEEGKTKITLADTVIAATGHSWNEGEVTTAATCTTDGVMTYTCGSCGETKTESIPATGHVDANLDGLCDNCGEAYEAVVYALATSAPAAGNNYVVVAKDEEGNYYALTTADVNAASSAGVKVTVVETEDGLKLVNPEENVIFLGKDGDYTASNVTYSGLVLAAGDKVLHLNSSKIRVTTSNQNATMSFAAGTVENTFTMANNQAESGVFRYLTFSAGKFGVNASAGADLYFFYAPCAHTETKVVNAAEATCSAEGYTGDVVCTLCGVVVETGKTIEKLAHTPGEVTGAVAPSCTEEGFTGTVSCTVCGEVIDAGSAIPATGHTEGTPVDNGDGTHTVSCTVCQAEIRTEAHSYVDGTCACGAKEAASEPTYDASLKFLSKSFTMGSSLNMVFIASKGTDTTRTIRAEVTKYNADGTTTVRTYTVADGNMNDQTRFVTFTFDGVAAKEMGDKVEAKLFATDASGNEFYGETLTLSLKDFLMNYAQSSNEAQKNLAVALLNYGAAAQVYFDYNYDGDTTKLVNNDLTEDQKVIDIREASATTVVSGDGCKCLTNSVLLESKIVLYAIFNLGSYASRIDELAAVVTNAATGEEVTRLTLTKGNGTLASFRFDDVSAKNTRTVFNIAIYDGETKISQDLQWSMECMVSSYRAASNTPAEKLNLANAMLAYGDYAAAYLG